jgi:hypothetical protein
MLAATLATVAAAGCGTSTSSITASGPFAYPSNISPPLQRVAVLVSITNHSTDDQQVNPADFVARDGDHHIYPANPVATLLMAIWCASRSAHAQRAWRYRR